MTNPTRQEIIDAHNALTHLINGGIACTYTRAAKEGVYECEKLIRKFLPPKPRPTMAEVEWDDDKHRFAEAENPDHGKVIMLERSACPGFIRIALAKENEPTWQAVKENTLTLTGKRYALTEVQE